MNWIPARNSAHSPASHAALLAAVTAGSMAGSASASFQYFVFRNDWQAAVGTPTTYLSAAALVPNATVDPEMWANSGVHMLASEPLRVAHDNGLGNAISSPFGVTFDIVFDHPINALFYSAATPIGSILYWRGDTYVGFTGDGDRGVICTETFDRIRISDGQWVGYLWNIEFGQPVPGPGGAAVLALAALTGATRRRRA